MPKNPTTPPKATRKSQRGRDNTNPVWAPKRKREHSPNTQRKLKISEIRGTENQLEQIRFFSGATKRGRLLLTLMGSALESRKVELLQIEDRQLNAELTMPQLKYDEYLAPGMWSTATGPAMAEEEFLAEGLTTEESSEVDSDNESGQTTPRTMTPII